MSEPFTGQVEIFGFAFAPRNWAQCNGQLLGIQQNQALFSILQTFYGGQNQALLSQGWTVDVEIFFYMLIPLMAIVVAGLVARWLPTGREERRRLVVWLLASSTLAFRPCAFLTAVVTWPRSFVTVVVRAS